MKILVLLLYLVLSVPSFGQPAPKPTNPTAIATQVAPATKVLVSEKDYYKMMYEQVKAEANAAHTDTQAAYAAMQSGYSTAITVILGVLAFITALQSLFSYRLNIQKIESFRTQIRAEIQDSQRTVLEALSTGHTANRDFLDTQIRGVEERLREMLTREVDIVRNQKANTPSSLNQQSDFNTNNYREITSLSTNIRAFLTEIKAKIMGADSLDEYVKGITALINKYKDSGANEIEHYVYKDMQLTIINSDIPAAIRKDNISKEVKDALGEAMHGLKTIHFLPDPANQSLLVKIS